MKRRKLLEALAREVRMHHICIDDRDRAEKGVDVWQECAEAWKGRCKDIEADNLEFRLRLEEGGLETQPLTDEQRKQALARRERRARGDFS